MSVAYRDVDEVVCPDICGVDATPCQVTRQERLRAIPLRAPASTQYTNRHITRITDTRRQTLNESIGAGQVATGHTSLVPGHMWGLSQVNTV